MRVPTIGTTNEASISPERVLSLAPDLAAVRVDPGQIEQVVLNLAINARDAMLDGGTLEIATSNFGIAEPWAHPALPVRVPAGAWVLLSVRDTGCVLHPVRRAADRGTRRLLMRSVGPCT